jgi:hypothetical protein
MTNANKPTHKTRLGRVSLAIWERLDPRGNRRYTATLYRTYKDGEEFRDTHTLDSDDLLHGMKLLEEAHNWIRSQPK